MTNTDLLDLLPTAVYMTDAQGRITYFNDAAADLWGHRPRLGSDQWCGSWRLFWPDGRPLPHDECPMAVSLKEGRPVRGIDAIAERPDGTRVRFLPYPTPLRDASGHLIGAINLLIDVSERYQTDLELARLAAIVASSDDAIISKTLDGEITSWNAGATRIFGYRAEEMIGQPIIQIIPPELHAEEKQIIARLKRGERVDHYETVRVTKDGRLVDVSLTVSPLRDKSGIVIGASKVGRDITERKQADKMQRLLVEELNHRVKNMLASIQAIASQSLRRAKKPADFVSSFSGRVQALARAHALLTKSKMQGADLTDLVREQVLLGATDERISCSGPVLVLDAQASLHMALVLHELATNARKYGALSVPGGSLSVQWKTRTAGGLTLAVEWKESGVPQVSAPKERGFGSTLIEQSLSAHGGEVSVCYGAEGVAYQLSLPLPQVRPTIGQSPAAAKDELGPSFLPSQSKRLPLRGRRIIIIEDEPLVAMDLESILTAAGSEVIGTAGTIDKARRLIADAECDAALLDANLAGHPVDDLIIALTKMNIPFAFVTGYGRESIPRGYQDAVLVRKPFSSDQLLEAVELLLYKPSDVVQLRQIIR
ncbi:PAS domain S-box-containing protein [Rhizobiales bacterium GAS191]|nr:PAS domain S-box-containing protein [Rhizobiales bacterium GAS191]